MKNCPAVKFQEIQQEEENTLNGQLSYPSTKKYYEEMHNLIREHRKKEEEQQNRQKTQQSANHAPMERRA